MAITSKVASVESSPSPGDVVRLKTGGPDMTVVGRTAQHDEIRVGWFDSDHVYQEVSLDGAAVAPVVRNAE